MKKRRQDAGFSLAALIFFATAASILAAAAVPAYQMQAKREREKELIFRGEEYTRAIQKYQRKFGVNPGSIDQLVQTNGLRFLRRAYKDPITGKDFRLIRINPDGSLSGSKVFGQNVNPQSLFGNTQIFGQQPGVQQPGVQQPGMQQPGVQQPGVQQPQQPTQLQRGQQPLAQQPLSFGQQPQAFFGQQSPMQPLQQPVQRPGQPAGQSPFNPIGSGTGTPVAAGGIIGVASDSDETSVMVYNQRQKYSEWEFLAILGMGGPQGLRGQQPGGQQPVQPGQIPGQGFQGQPSPFPTPIPSSPSASPFGPQTGATPFGPTMPFGSAPGPQQGQQPFGIGNPSPVPGQPAPGKRP